MRCGIIRVTAMATTDPRIDAYIAKAKPFAQPILERIRKTVHAGCPDVVETITGAKTDETRARRLQTAVQWIADGKSRNWKYAR